MKTEIYTWRVSPELKTGLEREARRRKLSMSAALDLAAREWLEKNGAGKDGEEEQLRLRRAASRFVGALASGDAKRSENVSTAVRRRLRSQYGR